MIAKIIAYGPRPAHDALARLRRALTDTTVVIEGGTTNKSFLLDLLDRPEVDRRQRRHRLDRPRTHPRRARRATRDAGVALVAAGIDAYDEAERGERARFFAAAHGGRPEARHELGRAFDLKLRGSTHRSRSPRSDRTATAYRRRHARRRRRRAAAGLHRPAHRRGPLAPRRHRRARRRPPRRGRRRRPPGHQGRGRRAARARAGARRAVPAAPGDEVAAGAPSSCSRA